MSREANLELVQSLYAAFDRADLAAILERLDPEIVWTMPGPADILPFAGEHRGHEGVVRLFGLLMSTVAFEALEPRRMLADDSTVLVVGSARTRLLATGRTVEHEWVARYEIAAGRIVQYRIYEDTAALAAAAR
jgi:hypothetical protein